MNTPAKANFSLVRTVIQWLPVIAFVAAVVYMWRSELAPEIQLVSIPLLIAASITQLLAFTMRAWLLRDFLKRFGIPLPRTAAIACVFKPILSKYIPGKVWLLLSTASMLDRHGISFQRASLVIAVFQITLAVSGLVLGAAALMAFQLPGVSESIRLSLLLVTLVLFAFLLGSGRLLQWLRLHIPQLSKKFSSMGEFPSLSAPAFYSLLHWLIIGLAFTLFLLSVDVDAGWYPVLFQPLAINLGVLAVIVPGGLGVREGAMAAYLALADVPLSYGLALAVAARIWFFVGEVLAFIIGLVVEHRDASRQQGKEGIHRSTQSNLDRS